MDYLKRLFVFNSSRFRLWQENAAFAASVPDGSLVLDAEAGHAPYKELFGHAQYETADFSKSRTRNMHHPLMFAILRESQSKITASISSSSIKLWNTFPEPQLVLAELYRVLKAGGKMIYTGPLFYEEHEQPYDFYRYTQFGLRHLFNSTGFVIERLDWLEGYFGTVGYQLNCMARSCLAIQAISLTALSDMHWRP